jgi:hypothetical protein
VLPGEILKYLDPEGFQVIQLIVVNPVSHRLYIAPVKAHEKYVVNGSYHMEMLAHGQKAQEEEKRYFMDKIGNRMHALQRRKR